MDKKKYIFVLSHSESKPIEAIGLMKIAMNMKAFDDSIDLDFFLIGEGVQLAKKGVADTISMEMEGQKVVVGEMLNTLVEDFNVKFYVCHAFLSAFSISKDDLIKNAEVKASSYLGELMLEGRVPFQLNL
ncbi:MAG: DsrE family protein [Nitrospiraceae bacterium]|nr:DsrE family protein [Nitrospiraceae bacterium]